MRDLRKYEQRLVLRSCETPGATHEDEQEHGGRHDGPRASSSPSVLHAAL